MMRSYLSLAGIALMAQAETSVDTFSFAINQPEPPQMAQTNGKDDTLSKPLHDQPVFQSVQTEANAATHSESKVLIAVMGQTGSGKSTFINLATQSERKLRVGKGVVSCTDTVNVSPSFNLDGREVVLYDTPGFSNTNKSDTDILRIIATELENQYRNGSKLHGVIYIHRISDIRVGGLKTANFDIFRKLCGDTSLKNVVIVTNMWKRILSKEEGEERVLKLRTMGNFFKPALAKGAQMMHHKDDTVESAHNIISAIFQNHPTPLKIQREIVDEGMEIDKTSAGFEVDKKLNAFKKECEKKLKEQFEAAEQAREEHDEETRQELLEEARKVQDAIRKLAEERAKHTKEYKRLQQEYETKRQEEAKQQHAREDAFRKQLEETRERDRCEHQNRLDEIRLVQEAERKKLEEKRAGQIEEFKRFQLDNERRREEEAKWRQAREDAFRKLLEEGGEQDGPKNQNRLDKMGVQEVEKKRLKEERANQAAQCLQQEKEKKQEIKGQARKNKDCLEHLEPLSPDYVYEDTRRMQWNELISRRGRVHAGEVESLNNELTQLAITSGVCYNIYWFNDPKYFWVLSESNSILTWTSTGSPAKWTFVKCNQKWKIKSTMHNSRYVTAKHWPDKLSNYQSEGMEFELRPNCEFREFMFVPDTVTPNSNMWGPYVIRLAETNRQEAKRQEKHEDAYGKQLEEVREWDRRSTLEKLTRKKGRLDRERERDWRENEEHRDYMEQMEAMQFEDAKKIRWDKLISNRERATGQERERLNDQLTQLAVTPGECHTIFDAKNNGFWGLSAWYPKDVKLKGLTVDSGSQTKWRFIKRGRNWKIRSMHNSQYLISVNHHAYASAHQESGGMEYKLCPMTNFKDFMIIDTLATNGSTWSSCVINRVG